MRDRWAGRPCWLNTRIGFLAAIMGLSVLAGCGSRSAEATTTTQPASTATTTTTTTTTAAVYETSEVEQLLTRYQEAWANSDMDGFLAIVTKKFTRNESVYEQAGDGFDILSSSTKRDAVSSEVNHSRWQIEHVGEPQVVGDGPWFVTIGENWTQGDTSSVYRGTATYGITDQDGTLKIATYYWVGLLDWN